MHKNRIVSAASFIMAIAVAILAAESGRPQPGDDGVKKRVFEIRTYTTEEGKLDALHARFRDHTTKLFEKHGMTNIGYWTPAEAPRSHDTLIYILAHASREAAKRSWQAFADDPAWHKARDASESGGKIVRKVESVFVEPTDYSPLQ